MVLILIGNPSHSCGTFQNNGTTFVIAAGGNNEADSSTTQVLTEIWDPSSDDGWIKGTDGEISLHIQTFIAKLICALKVLKYENAAKIRSYLSTKSTY